MRGGKKRFCIVPFVSLVIGDACRVLGIRERSNFEQLNLSGFKHTHSHADLAQLIRRNGYAVEEHFAETSDGYVLGLHRLPSSKADGGTPVVLQHGLLDSAATWVVNDAKHSLGFILADHGGVRRLARQFEGQHVCPQPHWLVDRVDPILGFLARRYGCI